MMLFENKQSPFYLEGMIIFGYEEMGEIFFRYELISKNPFGNTDITYCICLLKLTLSKQ